MKQDDHRALERQVAAAKDDEGRRQQQLEEARAERAKAMAHIEELNKRIQGGCAV